MLNKYPLWKYLLILAVLAVGFIYSAPNLYPDDPAVQISGASTALQVTQADVDKASKALADAGIAYDPAALHAAGLPPLGPDDAGGILKDHFYNRASTIFGGSSEIQRNIIAKAVLGL